MADRASNVAKDWREDEEEPRKKTSWRNLTIMFIRQRRRRPGIGNNKYERHSRKLKVFTAITYM